MIALAELLSYSDLGRAQNAGPTKSAPLRASWAPSLSGLDRRGAWSLGLASDGSLAELFRAWVVCTTSRGKPRVDETLQAHASNICLQHPSLPTARLNSEPSVSTTALPVSRWKSDTEETSKQRKLNRGNCLGSDPTQPTTPEKGPDIPLLLLQSFFLFFFELMGLHDCFFFFFCCFSSFFLSFLNF